MSRTARTGRKQFDGDVLFYSRLPSLKQILLQSHPSAERIIVISDKKLKTHPSLRLWKKPLARFYFIPSGEKEKTVEKLPFHLKKVLTLANGAGKDSLLLASIGGGSIGDLTGFLAAVYQRGVPLVHFPTTWLSALDSAHGGKTALNFKKIKNAVGTYWFPKKVFIVKDLLKHLPEKEKHSAFGELLKTALIKGGVFYNELKQRPPTGIRDWEKFLKHGIAAKRDIVKKDPYETQGLRRVLNLGHTLGHVLESAQGLPHGKAVLEGVLFSAEWSFKKQLLSEKHFLEIESLVSAHSPNKKQKKIPLIQFKKFLRQDKKRKNRREMDFVFIHRPGKAIILSVSETEILQEAKRQGWVGD